MNRRQFLKLGSLAAPAIVAPKVRALEHRYDLEKAKVIHVELIPQSFKDAYNGIPRGIPVFVDDCGYFQGVARGPVSQL